MQALVAVIREWLGIPDLATALRLLREASDQQQRDIDKRFELSAATRSAAIGRIDSEIEDLNRELDELKRDIIAAAVAPKPKDVSKPESRGREPWPVRRARIEAKERGKSDDMRPS